MTINLRNFLLPLVFLTILAACGGGGGGNGGSQNGPSNGLEMNSYLPAHADLDWKYMDGSYVIRYGAPRTEGDDSLDVRVYPTGGKDYFFTDTNTIAWRGFYSPTVVVSGAETFAIDVLFDRNFVLYDTGLQAGDSLSFSGSGTVNISPTYGKRSITVSGTSTFYGLESVVVPYGAFDNALHIGFSANVSVEIDGETISLSRSIEYWLVEGIGVVAFIEEGQLFELSDLNGPDRDGDGLLDVIDEFPDEPLPPPAHLLLVPDSGVALSQFATVGKLSQTVDVLDSYGLSTTNWIASSSEPWLNVTASGTTADGLVITADPTGLSPDTLHRATIQVSSPDAEIENTETINVGFWVGTTDPGEVASVNIGYSEIASDPVRPYVYLHNGGADIDVYNVYNQSLASIISGVGITLGDMEVSPDGRWLYVADLDNDSITVIDLDDTSSRSSWMAADDLMTGFTLTRTKGLQLLLAGHGTVYEAQSGIAYGALDYSHWYGGNHLDASLFGNRFCRLNGGLSPYDLACFDIDYDSSLDKVVITEIGELPHGSGSFGADVALNKDGSAAYVAASAPYEFTIIDIDSMSVAGSLEANAYPSAVEIGPDGALHGATSSSYGPLDMWVYEANGSLRKSVYVSGDSEEIYDRALAVSGDGYISISLGSGPQVFFVSSF